MTIEEMTQTHLSHYWLQPECFCACSELCMLVPILALHAAVGIKA